MTQLMEYQIKPGAVLRHHSGRIYTVLMLANNGNPSEKFPITVVYVGENNRVWARPREEFPGKFELVTAAPEGTAVIYVDPESEASFNPVPHIEQPPNLEMTGLVRELRGQVMTLTMRIRQLEAQAKPGIEEQKLTSYPNNGDYVEEYLKSDEVKS